jgi:phosphatidylserine/phosphatidylglycerophosphate/cardiolipin synthase-like enzyme
VLDRLDRAVGDRVADGFCSHHRRRLRNLGSDVLDAPAGGWAADAAALSDGNRLSVLIDGEQYLAALREALEGAESHVYLAGWFLSPDFQLAHDPPLTARDLLAGLAQRLRLRVLLWAGSPAPFYHPSRRDVRAVRDALGAAGVEHCALDSYERPLHCHHEKVVVIDDRVAFVGGIDLTEFSGNRLDSNAHPARAALGWHDVATRIEGPAAADVARHFAMRWRAVTGERLAEPAACEPQGETTVQVVRTLPERIYPDDRRGQFGILESYLRAFRSAERLIYLESQYLWSPELAEVLAERLRNPPGDDFRVVVVLPARPKGGGDDTRGMLGLLLEADGGRGQLLACSLYARAGRTQDPIYVHAKVGIIDDRWLTVGSANLNDHSLFNDSEMNVVSHDSELARDTRLRLWSEHLELPASEIDGDPTEVIDGVWRPLAERERANLEHGRPLTHRLVQLPHVSRRSDRLLGPLQALLVDG